MMARKLGDVYPVETLRTFVRIGFDHGAGMLTGTIEVEGARMRVWLPRVSDLNVYPFAAGKASGADDNTGADALMAGMPSHKDFGGKRSAPQPRRPP